MKSNGTENQTIAICFGQFGPYHHARVVALQREVKDQKTKRPKDQETRVVPVQVASATSTYAWSGPSGVAAPPQAEDLKTLCDGVEEAASPFDVFLKARKLFREEKVDVAFLPSYSPARYFALFAAAKSLGIRTVMMNESHAGTEQATGSAYALRVYGVTRRWIKRQIVKQFDAALVGGEPHKRHFASLGIPADKIFTGYDAVDNALFAAKADEVRSMEHGAWSMEQEGRQESGDRGQSEGGEDSVSVFQNLPTGCLAKPRLGFSDFRKTYGLPQRYFLSLGRMVEKKNLSTLVEAYARFARASGEKHGAGSREHGVRETTDTRHTPVALVFVGSGELESVLREQAKGLGLRVIDRTGWKAGESSHGLTRINTDKSERLAADRTKGNAASSVTRAGCGLSPETTGGEGATAMKTRDSLPATSHEENCGTVFFYGFRQIEENPVFYALAEAFVLPSLKEEWGLVVNEAMACSLPVIVSRTAGCAEDLLPGSESWQCSVGSVQSGENADADDCKLMSEESDEQEADARAGQSVEHGAGGMESGENAGSLNVQPSSINSLEERCNGFVFDPSSVDALSEALRRIADPLNPQLSTLNAAAMGRRSREIVAKFGCENFARQAMRAACAARGGGCESDW